MFAVPGWSLSPTLLKKQDDSEANGNTKKRKRQQADASEVTSQSLSNLYQQHVEKVAPNRSQRQKSVSRETKTAREPSEKSAHSRTDGQQPDDPSKTRDQEPSAIKSQKAEFRKAKREAQSKADKQKALEAREDAGLPTTSAKKSKKQKKQKTTQGDEKTQSSHEHATGKKDETGPDVSSAHHLVESPNLSSLPPAAKLTPLQAAMRQKLIGARFRHLNQTLYTTKSAEASKLFDGNPTFFEEYHAGFRSQVESWPENPVDTFVAEIRDRAKIKASSTKDKKKAVVDSESGLLPLPSTSGTCRIVDLGCGDAALAAKISKLRLNVQVLSYDLAKPNKFVTKADIANLPLEDDGINVAIFCLALMGTNWIDFIEEAWRVLHWKGELWIAEIKSRFGKVQTRRVEHSVGNRQKKKQNKQDGQRQKEREHQLNDEQLAHEVDEVPVNNEGTDVSSFVEVLQRRGFALHDDKSVDLSNKMFVRMKFVKALPPTKGKDVKKDQKPNGGLPQKKSFIDKETQQMDETAVLKPCLYKIR